MFRHRAVAVAIVLLAASPSAAEEFRIGFLSTLSGGGALVGTAMRNGFALGLAHEGWTKDGDPLGGVPTRVVYGDVQAKPNVAVREADRMLKSEKVNIVAGVDFSHVMMAIYRPVTGSRIPLLSTNAGPAPIAGALCSPFFASTSWQGDQVPEALGKLITNEKPRSLYLMAPNYQAGKDVIAGLLRTLKGPRIAGRSLFKLGETDFQADISKARALKPAALFIFAPGAMGISFMKQWEASGAGKEIRLYTSFVVDNLTLAAIGDAAIGTFHTMQWSPDFANAANQRFVKDYIARHRGGPPHYAAQSYDGARLIAAVLRGFKGRVPDAMAIARALRKTKFDSVRGAYSYNVNGFPVADYFKREVVRGPDGKPAIVSRGSVLKARKDAYWPKCPPANRL